MTEDRGAPGFDILIEGRAMSWLADLAPSGVSPEMLLLLIASTGSFRRPGARGTYLRLPGAIDMVVRALVTISATLVVVFALVVLFEPGFLPRPEWQAANPVPAPPWASLVEGWLVAGGTLAYVALNLVLVWSMRLVVVVGLINGFMVAIVGMSHMATSDPIASFVVFTGLITISVSAALWNRQQTARRWT